MPIVHVDLIAGLPGEDVASFAQGFDRLWALQPHEIQVGILKRLRGTPIIRHTGPYRFGVRRTAAVRDSGDRPHRLRDHAAPGAVLRATGI